MSTSSSSTSEISSTAVFSSNISERRWTQQLKHHFAIYMDNRPSIFKVPKTISDTNPAAYAPQQMGLGPYHHFRHDLVEMDHRKVEALKEFLTKKKQKSENFNSLIVEKLNEIEPLTRSCYNNYLDLDSDTLAWIMAIDGVYLLHFLSQYPEKIKKKKIEAGDRELAKDIMMLENQLPLTVLKKIREAANEMNKAASSKQKDVQDEDEEDEEEEEEEVTVKVKVATNDVKQEEKELASKFMWSFCQAHSPLNLQAKSQFVSNTNSPHLLSYMYSLIKYNWDSRKPQTRMAIGENADKVLQAAKIVGGITGNKHLQFLSNLPLQQFFDLFKNDQDSPNPSIEEIKIPSASQLHRVSKIEFRVWPANSAAGGLGIKYIPESRALLLPAIRLNTDSEVILRNLVAYEVASSSSSGSNNNLPVAGYVDFMCGIIDTVADVDLLKEKGIITTQLGSPEIVKIFNGINKSNRMRNDLEETTQKLNMVYSSSYRVKAWRFIKDHFVPSEDSVKVFLAILLVFLLSLQAFCQIYGCSAHWFSKSTSNLRGYFDA